jgi:ABC-type branched-subunit amino acid transport system ATPase component
VSDLVLTARDVSAGYGDEDILHGVSIDVKRGTIVAVIGPNGSGKSTLLKTMYGLVPARRGRVTLFAEAGRAVELTGLKPSRITALGVNMVPQLANVFPEMSVLENLEIGALPAHERFSGQLERVLAAFPMLRTMLRKRAATLSGGQRQMLGVARAMMSDPRVLILDEPSAGLAPAVLEEVFARVRAINQAGCRYGRAEGAAVPAMRLRRPRPGTESPSRVGSDPPPGSRGRPPLPRRAERPGQASG